MFLLPCARILSDFYAIPLKLAIAVIWAKRTQARCHLTDENSVKDSIFLSTPCEICRRCDLSKSEVAKAFLSFYSS